MLQTQKMHSFRTLKFTTDKVINKKKKAKVKNKLNLRMLLKNLQAQR